jgi:hypothetical protein
MDELPLAKKPKITAKGRRQKGKKFERDIAGLYRHYHIDDTAQAMPMSGAMDFHKGDILKKHDHGYVDECKNQETTHLWEWWAQATRQATGLQVPLLHIKRNLTQPITVMSTETYFQMRRETTDLREDLGIN